MPGEGGGEVTVLHVDDDPSVLETTAALLEHERESFTVVTETEPAAVLDRLDRETVDCVVSDYQMPGMDGLELLSAIRERHPTLPFVLFTGEGSEAVASDAIAAGVTDYLRKGGGPGQFSLLANRVANAVARRRAEDGYREIFAKVTDGIVLHDPETGDIRDANPGFCDMVGYDREQVRSMDVGDFSPDEPAYSREEARRRVREAATEGPQLFDWRLVAADGETLEVEVTLATTTIGGRETVLATVRDVTDRQLTRRRLRAIVEHVPQAVYIKDRDGRYEFVNDRTADVLEASPEAILGSTDEDLFDEADAERIRAIERRIVEREEPASYERRLSIGGETRVLRNEKYPYTDEDGAVVGVLGLSEDVTDRRERERTLRRQNERLEEFASVVSHDLRNPLNVAQGRFDLLDAEGEHAAAVESALDRMDRIVADVLALARQGGAVSDPEAVESRELVADAWSTVATAGATLEADFDRTLLADGDRLQRLLENLFVNAVEHGAGDGADGAGSRDGATVTVRVGATDDGFFVADDGPGIPPAERDRVFAPGYSTGADGTGLGLSIARDVADGHDWTVTVGDSWAGGARFEFSGVEFCEE